MTDQATAPEPAEDGGAPATTDRRRFLGSAGVAAASVGAAWLAPQVLSVSAASAASLPPGLVVAVGEFLGDAQAWTSTTLGVTWTGPTVLPVGDAAYGVAYDGSGLWVAVGDAIWTSPDAVTWTAATTIPFGFDGRSVATDGVGNWVSVGIAGDPVFRSASPGSSWQLPTAPPSGILSGVATDGIGTWVAVGATSSWQSQDLGATWSAIDTSFVNQWNAASVATDGNGNWVAVGPAGSWRWTTGAPQWLDATAPVSSAASAVATDGNGLWVAVGAVGSAGRAWTSTDAGSNWAAASQPPVDAVGGVAASGAGEWVTVGNGFSAGGSWTSADGDVWTPSATPLGGGIAVTPAFERLLP